MNIRAVHGRVMHQTSTTDFFRAEARALIPTFTERAPIWDRERRYCWENIADLRTAGFLGMTLPKEVGGRGASYADVLAVVEELAGACALTARVVVEANMGGIAAVMAYGSPEQKALCASLVLAGDKPAICITEPDAGSAATDMTTTARRVAGGFRVNGCKHWITGGGVSRLHLVFARIESEDGTYEGIGGLIVVCDPAEGETPEGFRIVRHEHTLGLCGMPEAELAFDDMFVAEDMLIQPAEGLRRGFAGLMSAYNSQRVGAGGVALGIAAGAMERARQYLLERAQFGRPIAEFQGLQWMLADMDAKVHAARLMLFDAARSTGPCGRFPDQTAAARAKVFATEAAIEVVNDALQMFGARGYGGQEPIERMYRDVRMFTIGGGTAQILRTQVASALLGMKLPQTRSGYAA
ncbi:MAG: 3-sulfinopropanoyl-CoA desulfinase [Pseudomonadota bacterium]